MAKLLFLMPQLPYPPHQGTTQRNYYILRGMADLHDISLLAFGEPTVPQPLQALCEQVVTVPEPTRSTVKRLTQMVTTRQADMGLRLYSAEFEQQLRQLLRQTAFDIVQIEGIELARYLYIVRDASPRTRVVFDNHNAETALQETAMRNDWQIMRRWPAAAYSTIQVRRLRRLERETVVAADATSVVSMADQKAIEQLFPQFQEPALYVVANSLDIQQLTSQIDRTAVDDDEIVFVGKMDYRPNVDAVLWFADEIFPKIRAKRPTARFTIVGQKPHARLDRLRTIDGITLTGWVASVLPYLNRAAAVVLPLRMGSGTRLKVIEALALGKALVSTSIGVEGYRLQHKSHLLVADDPLAFADATLRLLTEPDLRSRLASRGTEFAALYDWRKIVMQFAGIYRQVMPP